MLAVTGLLLALSPGGVADADTLRTTITLRIPSCNDSNETCLVYAVPPRPGPNSTGALTGHPVVNGTVTFSVRTAQTNGMVFEFYASWQEEADVTPGIAFQYEGFPPASEVTRPQASRALASSPCWVGTTAASITFDVAVRKVWVDGRGLDDDDDIQNRRVLMPMAWIRPTQDTFGPFLSTVNGVTDLNGRSPCNTARSS
jgi:hypothetical protein